MTRARRPATASPGTSPSTRRCTRSAWATTPSRPQRAIQVVVESWATPRTVLDVDLATREGTLLKRQPVLGDFDAADYAEHRVGHRLRRHAGPDLRRPSGGGQARRTSAGVVHRVRLLRDLVGPVLLRRRLSLLDRGIVVRHRPRARRRRVGRRWYDDGKILAKRNTFTDFVTAVITWWSRVDTARSRWARRWQCRRAADGAVLNLAPTGSGSPCGGAVRRRLTTILDPTCRSR